MNGFVGWTHTDGISASAQRMRDLLARSGKREEERKRPQADEHVEVWADGPTALGVMEAPSVPDSPRLCSHPSGVVGIGRVRLDRPDRVAERVGHDASASDMKLVLAAFSKWGPACVDHLQGAFAFVIWEASTRRLVAARDLFGREPLFLHEGSQGVAVASDLNLLRRLPAVSDRLNEKRVVDFLMFMYEDRSATFYDEVSRLPPGHQLVASPKGVRTRCYRTLSPAENLSCSTDREYAEAYRQHFFRAVQRAMRGSNQVGTWLSGGLDSSAVTCVARRLHPDSEPLPTFSLTFDAVPESDEQEFIKPIHNQGRYESHFVPGDEAGPLDGADEAMRILGTPFMTPNLFMTTTLLRAARREEVDVVLDGFLGDSVTGHGTGRMRELALTGRWITLVRELRAVAQHFGPSPATYCRLLHNYVVGPLFIDPLQHTWKDLMAQPAGDEAARRLVRPNLFQRTNWDERVRASGVGRDQVPLRERDAHEQEVTSGELVLAVETAVRMGRRMGVSVRFPFADEELISFCLALPARQKCRDGKTRVVAREALGDVLPEETANRHGKASLGAVFKRALFQLNRNALRSVVEDDLEAAREFIRPDRVRALFQQCIEENPSPDEIVRLWNVVLFARWISSREATSSPTEILPRESVAAAS